MVGVAPNTRLVAVKVLGSSGSGTTSQAVCGLDFVAANAAALNIKVASMSLSWFDPIGYSPCATTTNAMHKAICTLTNTHRVTVVASAGNGDDNFRATAPAKFPEVSKEKTSLCTRTCVRACVHLALLFLVLKNFWREIESS